VLELHTYDDVILGATEEMGASAAETQESLIRNGLLAGTNVVYCDNITLSTGAVTGTPVAPNQMEATDEVLSILTPEMVNKVVTKMKKDRVPRINGKYVAVIHPSVAEDLRKSNAWVEAHKYASPEEIFNGEIGELHGVRFIENPFAPVLKGEYVNKAGTATYATFFFGKEGFGIEEDIDVLTIPAPYQEFRFLYSLFSYIPGSILAGYRAGLIGEKFFRADRPLYREVDTISTSQIKII
jgi:N4-gp56 family major capsid protein